MERKKTPNFFRCFYGLMECLGLWYYNATAQIIFFTGNAQSNRERYPSEQQPGAWNCDDCTYSNHPSRTVCEMCGKIRSQGEYMKL